MAIYRYVAVDDRGIERQGTVNADDVRTAAGQLRAKRMFVVKLESLENVTATEKTALPSLYAVMPVGTASRVLFFRQLAMMLRSGLTLLAALTIVQETCGNVRLGIISRKIRDEIERGSSFSSALAAHRGIFDNVTVELVRSAEASGELDVVMERIGGDMERKLELRRDFITSLLYPSIVMLFGISITYFLIIEVVPVFADFFSKSGRPLTPALLSLVNFSKWLTDNKIILGFTVNFSIITVAVMYRKPEGRLSIDGLLLKVPLIGSLIECAALTRMSWTISLLLQSGVTLVEALRVGEAVAGNASLGLAMRKATERVIQGRDLSASLNQPPLPKFLYQMADVGEQTGSLVEIFQEVGDFYQKKLSMQLKRIIAFVEPALILVVGGMVGYIYYAFIQAIFAVTG